MSDELTRIDSEISHAESELDRWKETLKHLRYERSLEMNRVRQRALATGETRGVDAENMYIRVEDILPYVTRFIAENHRMPANERYLRWGAENRAGHVGGQVALALAARISTRSIRRIVNGETQHVSYSTADRLMSAMDLDIGSFDFEVVYGLHKRPFNKFDEG